MRRYVILCDVTDPNSMVPIGAALGGGMVLFVVSVVAYYVFKLDVVLWFRRTFPVLYANTGNTSPSHLHVSSLVKNSVMC